MDGLRMFRTGSTKKPVNHIRFEDDNGVDDIFEFGDTLGQGSFGIVIEAVKKATKTKYAVKSINKEKVRVYEVCQLIFYRFKKMLIFTTARKSGNIILTF